MQLLAGILLVASLASADESLIGTWMLEDGTDSFTIRDNGTFARETSIEVETILVLSEFGFEDEPDIEEALASLIQGRTITVSLSGTWESRGSRFLTVYQAAEVEGWEELVDEIMEIVTPTIENRQGGSDNAAFLINAYRGLLKSLFSARETFQFGEETFVYWNIEGEVLSMGGGVYKRVVPTPVKPISWGELKKR